MPPRSMPPLSARAAASTLSIQFGRRAAQRVQRGPGATRRRRQARPPGAELRAGDESATASDTGSRRIPKGHPPRRKHWRRPCPTIDLADRERRWSIEAVDSQPQSLDRPLHEVQQNSGMWVSGPTSPLLGLHLVEVANSDSRIEHEHARACARQGPNQSCPIASPAPPPLTLGQTPSSSSAQAAPTTGVPFL